MTTLLDYLERLKKLEAEVIKEPWTYGYGLAENRTAIPLLIKIIERQQQMLSQCEHNIGYVNSDKAVENMACLIYASHKDIDNLISEAGE